MVKQHPFTGTGIGTYFIVSNQYQDKTYKKYRFFKENAHNYYLQIASELGVFALLLWLLIIFISFKRGLRYLSFGTDTKEQNFVSGLLFGLAAYLLTMLTGHPLLLVSQQLFFWFYVAILAISSNFITIREADNSLISKTAIKYKYSTHLIILLLGGLFFWSYAYLTPRSDQYGFYKFESNVESFKDKSSELIFKWNWTMKEAQIDLLAASDILRLHVTAGKLNSTLPEGLKLNLFINDQLLDSIHFINGGSKILSYYVPDIKNTDIVLKLQVSRTFNPSLLGESSDNRDLGVQICVERNYETWPPLYNGLPIIQADNVILNKTAYIVQNKNTKINFPIRLFLNRLPLKGTGLYQNEKWPAGALPEGFNDNPAEVRWTGMRASIPLSERLKEEGGQIFLMAAHPDIQQNNVQMTVLADEQVIREETFSDNSWKKLSFIPEDLAETEILTFKLDRTWNPKLSGLSEDTRDLGAAVFMPK